MGVVERGDSATGATTAAAAPVRRRKERHRNQVPSPPLGEAMPAPFLIDLSANFYR
jgi:hypothetical protein